MFVILCYISPFSTIKQTISDSVSDPVGFLLLFFKVGQVLIWMVCFPRVCLACLVSTWTSFFRKATRSSSLLHPSRCPSLLCHFVIIPVWMDFHLTEERLKLFRCMGMSAYRILSKVWCICHKNTPHTLTFFKGQQLALELSSNWNLIIWLDFQILKNKLILMCFWKH